ncbi:MAG: hypothetical protein MHPSP_000243 [Paramarteilia canceri]
MIVERKEQQENVTNKIAAHYDGLINVSRSNSIIYDLKRLNNWLKCCLVYSAALNFKQQRVLDLCCGKGGDLQKWRNLNVSYLAAVDIAPQCVEECKFRYSKLKEKHPSKPMYDFECHVLDLGTEKLESCLESNEKFDIVSCQFGIHYLFESKEKINNFLQNISQYSKKGSVFVLTLPNSNKLMSKLREAPGCSFGNSLYSVEFERDVKKIAPKLFGEKYHFKLGDEVDLPEYLVYFKLLEALLKSFNFHKCLRMSFSDFMEESLSRSESFFAETLRSMNGLSILSEYKDNAKLQHLEDFVASGSLSSKRFVVLLMK